MALPPESGDLIERIGRTLDAYLRLSQRITKVKVSPEADLEIKRLLKIAFEKKLVVFKVDQYYLPYEIDKKMLGDTAFKLETELGFTDPAMAKALYAANRSRMTEH